MGIKELTMQRTFLIASSMTQRDHRNEISGNVAFSLSLSATSNDCANGPELRKPYTGAAML